MRSFAPKRVWKAFKHVAGEQWIKAASKIAEVNERPLFVLGNQKSGTTAVAALLAEHTGRSATLDFRFPSARALGEVYAGRCSVEAFVERRALYFARDIVKEPELAFLFEPLAAAFPQAQFVMVVRDPRDNIRSLLNRLRIPGHRERIDLSQFELGPVWRRIVTGSALEGRRENYVETLAARWNRAAGLYLRHSQTMPLLRYEDFLAGKEAQISELARRLGYAHVNDISDRVDVQFQPSGDACVSWFFGKHNLQRIQRVCGENMRALGYSLKPLGALPDQINQER